jgi:hypothetical protein
VTRVLAAHNVRRVAYRADLSPETVEKVLRGELLAEPLRALVGSALEYFKASEPENFAGVELPPQPSLGLVRLAPAPAPVQTDALDKFMDRAAAGVVPRTPITITIDAYAVRDARSALAMTIAWLESLHPTASRTQRLQVLRNAHDALATALRTPGAQKGVFE